MSDSFSGPKKWSKMMCNMPIFDNFSKLIIENQYIDRSISIFEKNWFGPWGYLHFTHMLSPLFVSLAPPTPLGIIACFLAKKERKN